MAICLEGSIYEDPTFPLRFEQILAPKSNNGFWMNWHVDIEILCITKGSGYILSNSKHTPVSEGDIAIINSNDIHMLYTIESPCDYFYLIPGKEFCNSMEIDISHTQFQDFIRDEYISKIFLAINREISDAKPLYKAKVKSKMISLLIHLYRNYLIEDEQSVSTIHSYQKQETVKAALQYIQENYMNDITLDELCKKLGFNKYYFCHLFKDMTGHTIINYINALRCDRARALITSNQYSITEVAQLCGFCNSSYFTKQYKKYIGTLPSATAKKQQM